MPNLQIDTRRFSAARAAAKARTHSKRQLQIADLIERFGFCNPILVDDDRTILAGHGRVKAAELLGLANVPTVRLSHLSEADKRAYVIADNRLAEKAGWDRDLLAIELRSLIDIGFEVELTGFEMPEIDLLLDEALEAAGLTSAADDELPEKVRILPPVGLEIYGSWASIACCAGMPGIRPVTRNCLAADPRTSCSPIPLITSPSTAMCRGTGAFATANSRWHRAR